MIAEPWQTRGFGLYVHWPFCEAKCPYCDFNSHVVSQVDQSRWARALSAEIARWADRTPGRRLSSIFFGGGTPSLMQPDTVEAVLEAARAWPWANDIEITLEANPRSVEADRFRGFAKAGVNRVSLGVQALNDQDLRRLGRLHGAREARDAFDVARSVFDRVSFDLIYARQDQELAAWEAELRAALDMAADHLSLYQLTLEPGTAFWDRYQSGGLRGLPDEDRAADMFEATQAITAEAGFSAYEVSNHARPGAESRHNLLYWRSGDWIGVGPGAHGRVTLNGTRRATVAYSAPGKWLAAAEAGCADESDTALNVADRAGEALMMGLRISEPLYLAEFPDDFADSRFIAELNDLHALGLIDRDGDAFRITESGRPLLNSILARLLPDDPTRG